MGNLQTAQRGGSKTGSEQKIAGMQCVHASAPIVMLKIMIDAARHTILVTDDLVRIRITFNERKRLNKVGQVKKNRGCINKHIIILEEVFL